MKRPWDSSIDGPFPLAVFSDLTRLLPSVFGHPTARLLSHCFTVCRHPARPPDHLPDSYYPAYAALFAFQLDVRPLVRWPRSCSACRRPPLPPPVARSVRVSPPFVGTRSLLSFQPRRSCDRLSVVSTVWRRRQRWPRKHVLSYENGGCQFAGPYLYKVCSWVPSTKCHGRN